MMAAAFQPRSAKHQHVRKPIVVVIRLDYIQAADNPCQTCFLGAFRERAIGIVVIETELVPQAE